MSEITKQITIKREIEVGNELHEDNLNELQKYLKGGYQIKKFSCTHLPRQDRDALEVGQERPTKIFMICSYIIEL